MWILVSAVGVQDKAGAILHSKFETHPFFCVLTKMVSTPCGGATLRCKAVAEKNYAGYHTTLRNVHGRTRAAKTFFLFL